MLHKFAFTALVALASAEVHYLGEFQNYAHGIHGKVYEIEERKIFIQDFEYDGAGPDAFFWIGNTPNVGEVGTILPHPFEGKFFEYDDQSAPILAERFDKVNITLTLPEDKTVDDFKWLSVWCRQFSVNFGDVIFKTEDHHDEGDHHEEPKEGELPPPRIPPTTPRSTTAEYEYTEPDADGEPEGESEPESEPEDGYDHHDHHNEVHGDDHHPKRKYGSGASSVEACAIATTLVLVAAVQKML